MNENPAAGAQAAGAVALPAQPDIDRSRALGLHAKRAPLSNPVSPYALR